MTFMSTPGALLRADDMDDFKAIIGKVATGSALTRQEATSAFDSMMSGEATPSQMGALLMALRVRGETVEEITGAASAMRAKMLSVAAPRDAVDIVGTGGDGSGSVNISTCAALITAATGVPVAKHGNRALSSKSGAADVLAALGVKVDLTPNEVGRCIKEAGIGFMFAPAHHPAMKNVQPTRTELATRTIFNLLGPLTNPAQASGQVVGVFSAELVGKLAEALAILGVRRALVVHGADGLDEITVTAATHVAEVRDGNVRSYEVTPEEFGVQRSSLDDIAGGDAAENAALIREVLAGKKSPRRDVVLLNAAAALVAAARADHIREALPDAIRALDSGAARSKLEQLVEFTNR